MQTSGAARGMRVDGSVWRAFAIASSFGFLAAGLVAGGVVGGRWLDRVTHTSPLFTIVGLLSGLVVGGLVFLRQVARLGGGSDKP